MGYSHHWRIKKSMPANTWRHDFTLFASHLLQVAAQEGIVLVYEYNTLAPPQLDRNVFRFNGRSPDHCETFMLTRQKQPDPCEFCKTKERKYEPAVLACLLFLSGNFPGYLEIINTDAMTGNFRAALRFLERVLAAYLDEDDAKVMLRRSLDVSTKLLQKAS